MKRFLVALAFLLMASAAAFSQEVSFKFLGGWTSIGGGDYNKGIQGIMDLARAGASSVSGAFEKLSGGTTYQAEITTHWGRRIATGFGVGYYKMGSDGLFRIQGLSAGTPFSTEAVFGPRLSVIPIFINVYYKLSLPAGLGLDLFAGPVFQAAQFNFNRQTTSSVSPFWETESFRTASPTLGIQAGVDLNYELAKGIRVVARGLYRAAKVSDLAGNWVLNSDTSAGTISNSSSEYYLWAYDFTQGGTYPLFGFFDKNGPSGPGISNARKAAIDLSGLTFSIGVRIDL